MEKDNNPTMDVIVHKANIPLASGESIQQFAQELGHAARNYALQRLNVPEGKGGGYTVEAYSNKVVVEIWQDGKTPRYTYQQMNYSRGKNGAFNFNDMTEMKRVTTFKPAASPISVAKEAKQPEQEIWEPVKKSIFGDIV